MEIKDLAYIEEEIENKEAMLITLSNIDDISEEEKNETISLGRKLTKLIELRNKANKALKDLEVF